MLAIRLQRIGRSGHAQYRVVVQDSRLSPKSGRVVAYLGSYNPHSKVLNLDKEKAEAYLNNGAQPSDRLARLLKQEGVKLPKWVSLAEPKKRQIRNADKLRRNRPPEEAAPAEPAAEETPEENAEAPAEAPAVEAPATETPTEKAGPATEESTSETETEAPDESSEETAEPVDKTSESTS